MAGSHAKIAQAAPKRNTLRRLSSATKDIETATAVGYNSTGNAEFCLAFEALRAMPGAGFTVQIVAARRADYARRLAAPGGIASTGMLDSR
jgi:septal ring-binding cell division protein DamX